MILSACAALGAGLLARVVCAQAPQPARASEGTEFWIALPPVPVVSVCGGERLDFGCQLGDPPLESGTKPQYGIIIQTTNAASETEVDATVDLLYFINGVQRHLEVIDETGTRVAADNMAVAPGSPRDLTIPLQISNACAGDPPGPADDDEPRDLNLVMNSELGDGSSVTPTTQGCAIRVLANAPVSVIVYVKQEDYRRLSDAYRALPLGRLDREYHVATWSRYEGAAMAGVVSARAVVIAPYPNTHVTYSAPLQGPYCAPVTGEATLGRGQLLHFRDVNRECDVNNRWPKLFPVVVDTPSIHITATKPVAVLVASDAAKLVDYGALPDAMLDQALPAATFSTDYPVPLFSREVNDAGASVRIVFREDDTHVRLLLVVETTSGLPDDAGVGDPWVYESARGMWELTLPHPQSAWEEPFAAGQVIDVPFPINREEVRRRSLRILADRPIGVILGGHSPKAHNMCGLPGSACQTTVLPRSEFQTEAQFNAIEWFAAVNEPLLASPGCMETSHYVLIVRPGRPEEDVIVSLEQPGGQPKVVEPGPMNWLSFGNPTGDPTQEFSYAEYLLHSDTPPYSNVGLKEWTIKATDSNGLPVPIAAYVTARNSAMQLIYPAMFAPAPPLPVDNVVLRDVLPSGDVEPVPDSFSHAPLDERSRELTWYLNDLPSVDEPVEVSYDAILRDLQPNTEKMVSEETSLSYFDEGRPVVRREGPVYVDVTGSAADLEIEVLREPPGSGGPPQFVSPEAAEFEVSFAAPAFLSRATFSNAADFADPERTRLDGISDRERPGSLVLERDGADGTQYITHGTARFTVDAGGIVDWATLGYDGGLAGCRLLDQPNMLAGQEIRDVEVVEIDAATYAAGGWWNGAGKSWSTAMVDETAVDHALSLEDGRAGTDPIWEPPLEAFVAVPRSEEIERFWEGSYTIEGWMRGDPDPDERLTLLWAQSTVDDNEQPIQDGDFVHLYRLGAATGLSDDLILAIGYHDAAGEPSVWTGSVTPAWGAGWNHIAVAIDRSTADAVVRMWINGASLEAGVAAQVPAIAVSGEMRLGGSGDPGGECYCGRLDEVRLYSRVLSDQELSEHGADVDAHITPRHAMGLIGRWNFDPSAEDQSENHLAGEFVGKARITGRSSDAAFPRRAYVVATEGGVDILDATEGSLWMRFATDRRFLFYTSDMMSDHAASGPNQVAVTQGRLFIATHPSTAVASEAPISIIDFADDRVLNIFQNDLVRLDEMESTGSSAPLTICRHMLSRQVETVELDSWGEMNLYAHTVTKLDALDMPNGTTMVAFASEQSSQYADRLVILSIDWSNDLMQGVDLVSEVTDSQMSASLYPLGVQDLVLARSGQSLDLYCRYLAPIVREEGWPYPVVGMAPTVDVLYGLEQIVADPALHLVPIQSANDSDAPGAYVWRPDARYGTMPDDPVVISTPPGRLSAYFVGADTGGGLLVHADASRHGDGNVVYVGGSNGLIRIDEDRADPSNESATLVVASLTGQAPSEVAALGGTSNYVSGVALQAGPGPEDEDRLWVGTAMLHDESAALTVLDTGFPMTQVGRIDGSSSPSLPGRTVLGVYGDVIITDRGLADCLPTSNIGLDPLDSASIAVRVRSAPSREAFDSLDASGRRGFTEELAFELGQAPLAEPGPRPSRFVASIPASVPSARFLQIEAEFTTDDPRITPILENIFATFTSTTLAIDVSVEGDADQQPTQESPSIPIARIGLSSSDLSGETVRWTRSFATGEVVPGSFRARATLVDTETGAELLTASDPFDVVAPPLGEIISNSVRTDRPSYVAHDNVEVTSVVGNETLNVPLDDVVVRLWLTRGTTEYPEYLATSYRIDRLEPDARPHVHREVFSVQPDLPAVTGYVVRQEVLLNGTPVAASQAPFAVLPQPNIVGTLEATPSVLDGSRDLTLELISTATNVGSQDLANVTLHVTITGPDGQPPRNPAGDPLPPVTFSASAGTMARGERFDQFVIPYEAVLKDGAYVAELTATAAQLPSEVHLDYAAFVVLHGDEGGSPPLYLAIDLGALPGDSDSAALSINADGDIVGYSGTGVGRHAVLWRCGEIHPIPGATAPSEAVSISDDGYVAGSLTNMGNERGFVWYSDPSSPAVPSTNAIEVGTLGGMHSAARAVSNGGGLNTVVGQAATLSSQFGFKATIDDLVPVQLPSPAGGTTATNATGVNDYGDIVGSYVRLGQTKPFLFSAGIMRDLGLPAPYTSIVLGDISNDGQAVGTATVAGGQTVAVATHDRLVRALNSPMGTNATARAVDDRGRVVGQVGAHAALWVGDSYRDLNDTSTLLNGECWDEITIASDISNDGRIVGTGLLAASGGSSAPHAVLLEPLPFDTNLLSSLTMWVRADVGATNDASGAVTRWKNVMCSANMDLVAPEGATPQRLSGACCDPAITFDGADGDSLEQDVAFTPDSSFTLFIVADVPDGSDGPLVSTGEGADAVDIVFQGGLIRLERHGGDLIFERPLNRGRSVYTVAATTGGDRVELFANGALVDFANDEVEIEQLQIGTNASGSTHLTCDVREILLFTSALDRAKRQQVEDYLGVKHDLRRSETLGAPLLWLRADTGVGLSSGRVEEWHNQAARFGTLSQTDHLLRPVVEAEGPACRPAITFDSTASEYLRAAGITRFVDAILTIDASGSMDGDYSGTPTRLDTAKTASRAFVDAFMQTDGNKIGLVWFSLVPRIEGEIALTCANSDFGACNPTPCEGHEDEANGIIPLSRYPTTPPLCETSPGQFSVMQALNEDCGLSGCAGSPTDYEGALEVLAAAFEETSSRKVAVFISDGEPQDANNTDDGIFNKVRALRDAGVVVHTVGIGLEPGEPPATRLHDMAELGGGSYYSVTSNADNLQQVLLAIEGDTDVLLEAGTLSATFACPMAAPINDEPILIIGRAQATASDPAAGLSVWRTMDEQLKIVLWGEGASGLWFESLAAPIVCDGKLNHLQIDFGGPDGQGVLRAFLNDMPVSAPIALGVGQRPAIDSTAVVLGGAPEGAVNASGVATTGFFTGSVAELLLYGEVLTVEGRSALSEYVNSKYDLVPPPNLPPIARAGSDQSVEDFGWDGTQSVTLDASGSVDPDGQSSELTYRWLEGVQEIATGPQPTIPLSLGTHVIEAHVTDPGGLTGIDTVVVAVTPISDGRVVHYRLDRWHGDDSKKAFDSSGNGFHLEISSDSFQYAPGRHDYSLVFDGGTFINAGELVAGGFFPQGSAPRTVSFWFEAHEDGVNPEAAVLDYGGGGVGERFRVTANADRVAIDFGGEIRGREGLALSPEWHHVVAIVPSGAAWSDQVRLYLDGQPMTPLTLDGAGPVPIQTGSEFGTIGISQEEVFHIGRVDELRLFAGEVSVEALYGEPPMAHWMMDEGAGELFADTTRIDPTNGLQAAVGDAQWDGDEYPRQSFLFFESGTEAMTESEVPLNVPDEFTVAAWISMMEAGPVLSQETSDGKAAWLGVTPDGPYTQLPGDKLQADYALDAQWHLVVLLASKKGVSFYVDGKDAGSFDTSDFVDAQGKLHFAGGDDVGSFKGSIDDVRLYDRILEKDELEELFARLLQ